MSTKSHIEYKSEALNQLEMSSDGFHDATSNLGQFVESLFDHTDDIKDVIADALSSAKHLITIAEALETSRLQPSDPSSKIFKNLSETLSLHAPIFNEASYKMQEAAELMLKASKQTLSRVE